MGRPGRRGRFTAAALLLLAVGSLATACTGSASPPPAQVVDAGPSPALTARVHAFVAGLEAGETTSLCSLVSPAHQRTCIEGFAAAAAEGVSVRPSGLAVGRIRVEGDRAVASITGQFCELAPELPTSCVHNRDRDLAVSKGRTVADAFASLDSSSPSASSVFVLPFVEIAGTWYATAA